MPCWWPWAGVPTPKVWSLLEAAGVAGGPSGIQTDRHLQNVQHAESTQPEMLREARSSRTTPAGRRSWPCGMRFCRPTLRRCGTRYPVPAFHRPGGGPSGFDRDRGLCEIRLSSPVQATTWPMGEMNRCAHRWRGGGVRESNASLRWPGAGGDHSCPAGRRDDRTSGRLPSTRAYQAGRLGAVDPRVTPLTRSASQRNWRCPRIQSGCWAGEWALCCTDCSRRGG